MNVWQCVIGLVGLTVCVGVVFVWHRGAQWRRFAKAFPLRTEAWPLEARPFLQGIQEAFRLPKSALSRLAPDLSPMALYLTLYPEHCIYDTGECERCLRFLRTRLGDACTREMLAEPLKTLAERWLAAPEPLGETV